MFFIKYYIIDNKEALIELRNLFILIHIPSSISLYNLNIIIVNFWGT